MKNRILALMLLLASANVVVSEDSAPAEVAPVAASVEEAPVKEEASAEVADAPAEEEAPVAQKEEEKEVVEQQNDADDAEVAAVEEQAAPVVSVDTTYKGMAVDFVKGVHARSINFVNENPHTALAIVFAAGAISHWVAEVAYENLWAADNN